MNTEQKPHSSALKKWLPWLLVVISLPIAFYIYESGKQNSRWFGNDVSEKKSVLKGKELKGKELKDKAEKKKADVLPSKQRKKSQRIVNVAELQRSDYQPKWQTTGLVKAAESVKIVAQVAGQVEEINHAAFPGALIEKAQWLVQLEQTDYLLNLRTAQSQLIQAQTNLSLEMADQQLAKEELSLVEHLDQSIEVALVLREPQLAAATAKVDMAKVSVEKSELALKRTKVMMPFTGKVISQAVGQGSRVGQNSQLFEVVNVEQFYLEIKIPRSFLPLLDQQQSITLSQEKLWGNGNTRQAKVLSILPELDVRDRQVKVLLLIEDPLLISSPVKSPQIFINDFLTVSITGKALNDVWVLKDNWLQADNTIWVVDKNATLQKRAVKVIFKGQDKLYVEADFQPNDRALNEKPGIASVGLAVRVKQPNYSHSVEAN
ncbi:efflux RND transporter periplasmic adaptor subunit [Thalassotalea sp. PLHSN55]|uniref:efflux RND transporter periplasmic adaptor subunit n=1 Tax=Thalassotalea sp. PLHSN55 TaxID=3435888 RepID=UPI003F87B952